MSDQMIKVIGAALVALVLMAIHMILMASAYPEAPAWALSMFGVIVANIIYWSIVNTPDD